MLKLNIGAGPTRIPGFIPIDRKLGTEACPLPPFVVWEGKRWDLGDDSVGEIRASHILEHFSFADVRRALAEWVRVLKPGGLMKVAVPDIELILDNTDNKLWPHWLMGGQQDADDFHRSIFTDETLRREMRLAGLEQLVPWCCDNTDTASHLISRNVQGIKP